MSERPPEDRLLEAAFPSREPTPADLIRQELAFRQGAGLEGGTARRTAPGARAAALAAGVALLILTGLLVWIRQPDPAVALGEVAQAAAQQPIVDIPDGWFLYTRSASRYIHTVTNIDTGTSFIYQLPEIREDWRDGEGFLQWQRIPGEPEFFREEDAEAFNNSPVSTEVVPGKARVETMNNADQLLAQQWPTDPARLEVALRQRSNVAGDRGVAELGLSLLRNPLTAPPLRAAILQVLSGLEIELVDEDPASLTFEVVELRSGGRASQFVVSPDGRLLAERTVLPEGDAGLGIPPGTIAGLVRYEEAALVPRLGARPADD